MPTKSKKARAQRRASGVGSGRMVSRLRRRYTRVVKMGDHWNTYLQIDHQGFCVVEQTTRERAQWFGKMLAVALDRMLSANGRDEQRAGSAATPKHSTNEKL